MFTRIYNSARSILSRSPSVTEPLREELIHSDLETTSGMVTTRRGTAVETATPIGSERTAKRALEEDNESLSSMKRRKNSISENEDILEDTPDARPSKPRPSSPQVVIEKNCPPTLATPKTSSGTTDVNEQIPATQETVYHTPATERTNSVYATSVTRRAKMASPTPQVKPNIEVESAGKSSKKPKRAKGSQKQAGFNDTPSSKPLMAAESNGIAEPLLAVNSIDEAPSSPFDTKQLDPTSTEPVHQELISSTKKAHIRFDSEEPPSISAEIPVLNPIVEDDPASDSDEAPETVTRASALAQSKAADADATRAYKDLEAKQKAKRQERAAQLEKAQKKRRRKEEKAAKKKAAQELLADDKVEEEEEDGGLTLDINNLPALLPDSILAAAPEKRPPTPPRTVLPESFDLDKKRKEKLNRHIKFLERGERPIKDVQRGPIKVHVLGGENPLLAPKVNRDTKNVRERWLKGREDAKRAKGKRVRKVERRATGKGFLRD